MAEHCPRLRAALMKAIAFTLAACAFFLSAITMTLLKQSLDRTSVAEQHVAVLTDRVSQQAEILDSQTQIIEVLNDQLTLTLDAMGDVVKNQKSLATLYERWDRQSRSLASYGG